MASSSSLVPSSSDLTHVMKRGRRCINWSELPSELTSSILQRLGAIEILGNAQKVCTSWRRVCKDPSMWRKIVMHDLGESMEFDLEIMSGNLRSLKLAKCYSVTDHGFERAVVKLPLLEDLEVSYCLLSEESLKVVGQSCHNLKTLKLNRRGLRRPRFENDDEALAIAETMHGLRHLQLFGNSLSNTGLSSILDNCPYLEHLDLRQCFNVSIVGDLEKRCSERIKFVRYPNDSTHDYPFDATVFHMDSDEEDYFDCYDFDNYD
uniref:F-box domain-containing protein n=1 Tax=Brassica oleracea var. oleracea TaxID=109376 RepID=A0A0D3B548_BRAOL